MVFQTQPGASSVKPHDELAALQYTRVHHLVDRALVGGLDGAQGDLLRARARNVDGWAGGMRGGAGKIEFGRVFRVGTGKRQLAHAHTDVKAVFASQLIFLAVGRHRALPADVDDSHLAPLQEEVHPQLLGRLRGHFLIHGAGAADDDAVDVAVDHVKVVRFKQVVDQQVLPDASRIQGL
jgi:hypothetical protein